MIKGIIVACGTHSPHFINNFPMCSIVDYPFSLENMEKSRVLYPLGKYQNLSIISDMSSCT